MDALERAIDTIHRQNKKVAVDYTKGKDVTVITLLCEEAEVAIKALEKQVPKKPRYIDNDANYFECHACGGAIYSTDSLSTHKYCLECGQAIDWSVEK